MNTLPAGYSLIPATSINSTSGGPAVSMPTFAMAKTPVTIAQYQSVIKNDRFFVGLDHNYRTGITTFLGAGRDPEEIFGGPIRIPDPNQCFGVSHGDVVFFGSRVLLKMNKRPWENVTQEYNWNCFDNEDHPVVGISYFHAVAWCFLMRDQSESLGYDLPTEQQFKVVESLALHEDRKIKLNKGAHNELKSTYGVYDDVYQVAPSNFMGVQVTGNVKRLLKVQPAQSLDFWRSDSSCPLGGDSWKTILSKRPVDGRRATYILARSSDIGFQPVINL